jgi:23S rRNA pseudouridine1911/1915/1917 synthase
LLVVDKPQGMVVHPAPGHPGGTLVNALLYHIGDLSGIGGELRPGIVHRIDKMTSGLLVVAKNDAAHRGLSEQFRNHTAHRSYIALVDGNIKQDDGTVDAPVARHLVDRKKMAIVPGGREAITHWQVAERYGQYTLLRLELETGRTHQIRVHMASLQHPVTGDDVYGRAKLPFGLKGQALHGYRLTFVHPESDDAMCFYAPPPEYFMTALKKAGGEQSAEELLESLKRLENKGE